MPKKASLVTQPTSLNFLPTYKIKNQSGDKIMMEPAVEFMLGTTLLFIGISYIFRLNDWIILLEHLEKKGHRGAISMGIAFTIAGTFILGAHWVWENSLSVITTIIGVVFLVRGLVCLTYPGFLIAKVRVLLKHAKTNLKLAGLFCILLSAVILHGWWQLQYGWQYQIQQEWQNTDFESISPTGEYQQELPAEDTSPN
jgi:hypothetical protein